MSGTTGRMGLYLFVIVMNLVFPVFAYTFTTFGDEPEKFEIPLDIDTLNMAGITLKDAESHNLTYGGAWVEYTEINLTIRARWNLNRLMFQVRSGIGKAFNSWIFPYRVDVKSMKSNLWYQALTNASMVLEWSPKYNWSRFVLAEGHQIFITPEDTHNNITRGIFQDGNLNVTIAKTFEEETHFNFWRFLGWYTSMLIGDQSWGLPTMFSWVIRILMAVSVLSIVMLTKELTRI